MEGGEKTREGENVLREINMSSSLWHFHVYKTLHHVA